MKIRNIDIDNIGLDTSLDLDLNISDIDMDVFINDFSKRFDIDVSSFKWGEQYDYPDEREMSLLYLFFRSFNYKRNWVKKICSKLYKPKIYLRDLQNAIENKVL